MINISYDVIERNKNKIVNVGLIVLALVIAFQFYRSANNQVNSLMEQQNNELEKNKVIEDISVLEKKADKYKKVFVKKDLASIIDIISGIAKNSGVKILSVKPSAEEIQENYLNSSFLIILEAPGFHVLGDFISKIENHPDIYLVTEVNISSTAATSEEENAKLGLSASLKVNTISYL